MPTIRISALGLSAGMFSDLPVNLLPPRASPNLENVHVRRGFLRPRFGSLAFADRPNNDPVIKLFSARREDGTSELFRIKNRSDGGQGEIRRFDGANWAVIADGAGVANGTLGGNDLDAWDAAVVLDKPIFVNGVADNVYWNPADGKLTLLTGNKSRYVVQYLAATFLAHQVDGGITRVNQIQFSAPATFNDFASLGSGKVQLRDDPYPITGLSVNRRFTVYKERSIVVGVPTGEKSRPIAYQSLNTGGIGLWASGLIGKLGVTDVFLASDDFYTFDGSGLPTPLQAPIRELLLSEINAVRLRQGHTLHDPDLGEVYFFIPTGDDRFPRTAYVWNYKLNAWWRWQYASQIGASAAHAISLSDTWATTVGTWDEDVGTWADLAGVSGRLSNILGEAGEPTSPAGSTIYGRTLRLDAGANTDPFATPATVTWFYDLPSVDLEGAALDEKGQQIAVVKARDMKDLVQVDVLYQDLGASTPVVLSVSTDDGQNYQTFASGALGGQGAGVHRASFYGKLSGERLRLRLSLGSLGAPNTNAGFSIRDVFLYLHTVGGGR